MGPVTRAGCEARCPSSIAGCEGCRGPIDNPNIDAEKIFSKIWLTVEDIMESFNLYNACKNIGIT